MKKKVDKGVEKINSMSNEEFLSYYKQYKLRSGIGCVVGLVLLILLFLLLMRAFGRISCNSHCVHCDFKVY